MTMEEVFRRQYNETRRRRELYQERVVQELKELDSKIEKLTVFLGNILFPTLPKDEQARMRRQLNVMTEYQSILRERIKHFPQGASA
jgi:hypothetical protein